MIKRRSNGPSRVALEDPTGERVVDLLQARENVARVWTDGSCWKGVGGVGVIYDDRPFRLEMSLPLHGNHTNNTAELLAVVKGLRLAPDRHMALDVFCDSEYVIGVLALNWNASKNAELIHKARKLYNKFSDVRFVKVPGHSGFEGNEVADWLAGTARKTRVERIWRSDDGDLSCSTCGRPAHLDLDDGLYLCSKGHSEVRALPWRYKEIKPQDSRS